MSKTAAYKVLYEQLKEKITNSTYKKGDFLPPEPVLCEMYQVSRTTVRKAVQELVKAGLVTVRQGRGTQVCDIKTYQHLNNVSSFTQTLRARGYLVETRGMHIALETPPQHVAEALGLSPHEKTYHLQRILCADGSPIGFMDNYLVQELFPKFEEANHRFTSLYDFIKEEYGIKITSSLDTIGAKCADFIESQLLQIPVGSPLLTNNRITFCENKPFEYVSMLADASKYEFTVLLKEDNA